jgi:hypothetical protein
LPQNECPPLEKCMTTDIVYNATVTTCIKHHIGMASTRIPICVFRGKTRYFEREKTNNIYLTKIENSFNMHEIIKINS